MCVTINKNFMNTNHTAKKRSKADIKWIVLHYVGALGDAKANTEYYKNTYVGASADFFVGFAGDVWQANDYYNYYSWHCGGGYQSSWTQNGGGEFYGQCTNSNSIGIEMCVRKKSTKTMNATDTDWYFETATVNAAVELVAKLMKELDIDINHVIRHYQVNRKICPNPFVVDNNKWLTFKSKVSDLYKNGGNTMPTETKWYRVRKTWADNSSQIGAFESLENAKANCPVGYQVFDSNGKSVYTAVDATSSAATSSATSTPPYRVRKSWADSASQIGSFDVLANAKAACREGYSVYDSTGKAVYSVAPRKVTTENMTATDLNGLSEAAKIAKVAPIYQKVMKETGMLASVGLAQFCLESGYATTDLAQHANNMHGMKCSLSNNTWANSVWDGKSKYTKKTAEQTPTGQVYYVMADFRKYPSILKSVQDRAAYFIGAWLDAAKTKKRYPNVNMIKDAEAQVKLLKSGGYATDVNYVSKLMNIINRFNLTQYDKGIEPSVWKTTTTASSTTTPTTSDIIYRIATAYSNGKYTNQQGAFINKNNAILACQKLGGNYKVFDDKGKQIYPVSSATTAKPTTPTDIYAVRKTFDDTKTQLGLYSVFDNAKRVAEQNPGYSVWDTTTKKVMYTPVVSATNRFIAKLREMDSTVKADIKAKKYWTYKNKNTSTLAKTFEKARNTGNRKTNCSTAVYWGLIGSGAVNSNRDGIQWYGNNGFVWLNKNAKANALKYFELINVGNKTVKQCIVDGTLKSGDIISYVGLGHTNVYLGNGQSFDSGHHNCSGSGDGAKFKCWIGTVGYQNYKVAQILRLKSGKQYRVQCGVYSVKANGEAYVARLKEKGFDATLVQNGKDFIVQVGIFSSKDNADALWKKVMKAGFSCSVVTI